jgi:hypothetical protein
MKILMLYLPKAALANSPQKLKKALIVFVGRLSTKNHVVTVCVRTFRSAQVGDVTSYQRWSTNTIHRATEYEYDHQVYFPF